LQGLDVACFGQLKQIWAKHIQELTVQEVKITNLNFLEHYRKLRERVFIPSTIKSAFARTGIWPFNPNIISPVQMALPTPH
jgi:hypothetical protein